MSFMFSPPVIPKHIYRVVKKGAPGFEPGTSRSAVECSTTELYPQMKNFKQFGVLIGDNLNGYNRYKLRVKTFCKKKKDDSSLSFTSDNFIDLIGKGDVYIYR